MGGQTQWRDRHGPGPQPTSSLPKEMASPRGACRLGGEPPRHSRGRLCCMASAPFGRPFDFAQGRLLGPCGGETAWRMPSGEAKPTGPGRSPVASNKANRQPVVPTKSMAGRGTARRAKRTQSASVRCTNKPNYTRTEVQGRGVSGPPASAGVTVGAGTACTNEANWSPEGLGDRTNEANRSAAGCTNEANSHRAGQVSLDGRKGYVFRQGLSHQQSRFPGRASRETPCGVTTNARANAPNEANW